MNRPIRVLIIDDHPLVRRALAELLENDDSIEIVGEAANGWDGLKLATETEPDVVLLDYRMPGMNGAQTAVALLSQQPDMLVVGMSNDDRPHIRRKMLEAGAHDFLVKGDDVSRVIESILEACV